MSDSPATRAVTQYADAPSGRLAYRRFGTRGGVPLVLALRFRGTMDHWDPDFLDPLAFERDVIVFDNVGTGRSTGEPPTTIGGLASGLLEFVKVMELGEVDLLGWSLGGIVVQAAALQAPEVIRRLIVAGNSPGGGVPGQPSPDPRVWEVALKEANDDEDFLYLFYPDTPTDRELGVASLRRIDQRVLEATHVRVARGHRGSGIRRHDDRLIDLGPDGRTDNARARRERCTGRDDQRLRELRDDQSARERKTGPLQRLRPRVSLPTRRGFRPRGVELPRVAAANLLRTPAGTHLLSRRFHCDNAAVVASYTRA